MSLFCCRRPKPLEEIFTSIICGNGRFVDVEPKMVFFCMCTDCVVLSTVNRTERELFIDKQPKTQKTMKILSGQIPSVNTYIVKIRHAKTINQWLVGLLSCVSGEVEDMEFTQEKMDVENDVELISLNLKSLSLPLFLAVIRDKPLL